MPISLAIVAALTLLGGCVVGSDENIDPTSLPTETSTSSSAPAPETTKSPAPSEPPTSSIVIDAEPGADWPEHCRPDQVAALLEFFVGAFNAGDTDTLLGILPDAANTTPRDVLLASAVADPIAVADAAVALQWLSMPDGDGEVVVASSIEEVVAFVRSRYVDGDRMSLEWIKPVPPNNVPGVVDLGVEATLQTGDGMEIALEGKAGIDCSHERLYLWSVGPA